MWPKVWRYELILTGALIFAPCFSVVAQAQQAETEIVVRGWIESIDHMNDQLVVSDEAEVKNYTITVDATALILRDYTEVPLDALHVGDRVTLFGTPRQGRIISDWIDAESTHRRRG